jgi:hypothetical protein
MNNLKLGDRIESNRTKFPQLTRNQIALTWIVYDPPVPVNTGGALSPQLSGTTRRGFSYRGGERIYPASVCETFLPSCST